MDFRFLFRKGNRIGRISGFIGRLVKIFRRREIIEI